MQKAHFSKYHAFTLLVAGAMSFFPLTAYAATTGSLSGTVKSTTGQPVAGAQVKIVGTGETAKTDSGGNYNFTGEEPGTVTIQVTSATFKAETLTATVTQDQTQQLNFVLERSVQTGVTRVIVPGVARTQTSTTTVITAEAEQKVKSQPNNLYQFPGLLFGQPGITYDPGGYLHIRGSDLFQVGFLLDGVSVIDPITNEFATNIVTVGLKSANFYTNVADPSYGGATGGFINEITTNGRDLHAQGIKGITELTIGPSSKWNYIGTNTQFGDLSKDGKFDYYASTIRFRNSFPAGFGVVKLPDSQDTLFKVNYYADPNNQISALYAHGLEDYEYGPRGNLKIEQPTFDTNPNNVNDYGVDSDVQHYDLGYVSLRHRFTPQSFINYRYSSVFSVLTQHLEQTANEFRKQASTADTNQLDYQNQLTKKFQLKAGIQYVGSHNNYHLITGVTDAFENLPSRGYNDRANLINTAETDAYLGGELKPNGDKLTIDLGARYAERGYRNIGRLDPFKDHYLDPRAGIAFSPNRDLTFHSTLTRTGQMPETRYIAYLEPGDPSGVDPFPSTAVTPPGQRTQLSREASYIPNKLTPYYSENFDLGVDKAFKAFGNSFAVSLTGFSKKQYDLLTLQYSSFAPISLPLQYQNTGRGQDTGAEFVFSKRAKNEYDLNGFLSYTNSVTRATSSAFDTGYIPYFGDFVTDPTITNAQYNSLNKQEFSTSYDQRHTVAAVVSKKFNRFFGTSVVLDAGSGFPFNRGTASDGVTLSNADGQHGEKSFGSNASLSEVPVLLNNGALSPLSPVVGNSGWHYKISLNSDLFVSKDTNLFFNVDNVFDKLTATVISTTDANGQVYYSGPTAAQPQGHIFYGRGAGSVTPIFISFGFRHKF